MVQYMYANYHWPCYLEFTHILKKCKQPFSVPHALHAALVLVHGTAKGVAQSRAAEDDGVVKRSPPECCAIFSRSDGLLRRCLISNCHSHSRVVACRYGLFGMYTTESHPLAGAFARNRSRVLEHSNKQSSPFRFRKCGPSDIDLAFLHWSGYEPSQFSAALLER